MNKELKAAIILRYGAQYPFAAALGIREATVSAVIRGHYVLDTDSQRKWAKILRAPVKRLFQEGNSNG